MSLCHTHITYHTSTTHNALQNASHMSFAFRVTNSMNLRQNEATLTTFCFVAWSERYLLVIVVVLCSAMRVGGGHVPCLLSMPSIVSFTFGLSEFMRDMQKFCQFFNGRLHVGILNDQEIVHHCHMIDGKPCCKDKARRATL